MKLVPILASIVTGFAILATVGKASASATEFDLYGTFASTDYAGTTGLTGGSFDGTFSYSEGAVPAGSTKNLSSFSINLLNASNTVVNTYISNNAGNVGLIYGAPYNSDSDFLLFENTDSILELAFPIGFQGIGNLTVNNIFSNGFDSSSFIYATSAISKPVSQSVPEPSTIAGTIAAGAVLMVMGLKKSKRQKAFQAA